MCGMFGILDQHWLSFVDFDCFSKLGVTSYLRGSHGFGVARIHKNGEVNIKKSDEPIIEWIDTSDWSDFIEDRKFVVKKNVRVKSASHDVTCLMGHTRYATIGGLSVDNNHPFDRDTITGFHNGTFTGSYPHEKEFGTDSEALIHAIDLEYKESLDEAKELGLLPLIIANQTKRFEESSSKAAYALQIFDKINNRVLFFRNKERGLNFRFHKTGLSWASDSRFLMIATDYSGNPADFQHHKDFDNMWKDSKLINNVGTVFSVEPHVVLSVSLDKGKDPLLETIQLFDFKEEMKFEKKSWITLPWENWEQDRWGTA